MTTLPDDETRPIARADDHDAPPVIAAALVEEALDALGIDLPPDSGDIVVPDAFMSDEFGVTLVTGEPHGPSTRVAWLHGASAAAMDEEVGRMRAELGGVELQVEAMELGGHRGVVVRGVPGRGETTVALLDVDGRLLRITEVAGAAGGGDLPEMRRRTAPISFRAPGRALPDLPPEEATLRNLPPSRPRTVEPKEVEPAGDPPLEGEPALAEAPPLSAQAAGCATWTHDRVVQTPIDSTANGTGFTRAGPSFHGVGYHQRCDHPSRLNDHYALDYGLREDDPVLPPATGKVEWTGWAKMGWSSLGRVVIIDHGNGFRSASAHLHSIAVNVGDPVTLSTVIGFAGGSGNGIDHFFGNHLHQGIYLNSQLSTAYGGVYGGQSVRPVDIRFARDGGGVIREYTKGMSVSW